MASLQEPHSAELSFLPELMEFDDDDELNSPTSTERNREHGKQWRREKAAKEQYLTPNEENGLVAYILRMSQNGYPLAVKVLRSLALVIRRQRERAPDAQGLSEPGKNWPQGFYKRNPQLKSRRMRAMAWDRHDQNIYPKVTEWFSVISEELARPDVLTENVYNMDETGVLLGKLGSLKVLVGKNELRNYRGASPKRTLITAIECISATGNCLDPLVIWPSATHRSNWTTHPTPGWHFACTKKGYTNNKINIYWIKHVFEPLTGATANGKPRILISDGLASHECLKVMTFCYEHNIILCRLPSHTSHKLQPCDVAVFGPLKTAYREQVERLFRGGAGTIGKQHFTLLYSRARATAMTARNVRSAWSKAGLVPLNPQRVLRTLEAPHLQPEPLLALTSAPPDSENMHNPPMTLKTPTSANGLARMRDTIDEVLRAMSDDNSKLHVQKLYNAAEQSLANCALLTDENKFLVEQNCEKKARQAVRATIPGPAKIMTYEDIVHARQAQEEKEAGVATRKRKRAARSQPETTGTSALEAEAAAAERQIAAAGLSEHCGVLVFS
ncbi:hypothetical protein MBLNU13_g11328t1 [Cladosporium sp. NU13]